MTNYAIENGMKYFMYFDTENDVMTIKDIVETKNKFCSRGEWIINGELCHKSLQDCIDDLSNYGKPIMYKGENVNVWVDDIFVTYSNGNYYRDQHRDSTVLEKFKAQNGEV